MNSGRLACPRCGKVNLVIKQCDGRTTASTVYWVFCEDCKFDGVIKIGT
jgi:predicted RNA-binding Zn-ribbon protein involved in translation (DUF1610 family)